MIGREILECDFHINTASIEHKEFEVVIKGYN